MSHSFRPAIKTEAKPIIGLYSESGCGKTKSSLLLARGFAGPTGRVGMIETEAGRGEAFRDEIPNGYDVLSMRESFSPREYGEAITVAEQAGLAALIIDSASHEWEGIGGVLHMAAKNQEDNKKGPLVWQAPKIDHQRHFIGRLIATPVPLVIVCMRAKYPMQERKGEKGEKEWFRSEQLDPKQSDDILYEMFVHGWIDREHKFHGTKYTLDELRQVICDNEVITLDTGKRLAEWTRGGATSAPIAAEKTSATNATVHAPASPGPTTDRQAVLAEIRRELGALKDNAQRQAASKSTFGVALWADIEALPLDALKAAVTPAEGANIARLEAECIKAREAA